MMKGAKNSWKLTSLDHDKTRLNMKATIIPKGVLATMVKPMIKIQFNSMTRKLAEEFKYYVENGVPHPRKLKAQGKKAA